MSRGDDDREWDDPPLPDDPDHGRDIRWPTNGYRAAAWGGWLALAYGVVTGASTLFAGGLPVQGTLVALLGLGLLLGVRLAGGDPWARE
jgi:hypothetical protein